MNRVLFLSYDGMTDPLGQSQVLPYLTGLAEEGFAISLLSCEKPERFEKGRADIEAWCSRAGIDWQPILYTAKPPVISTVRDIRNMRRKAAALHHEQPFDLVHCRSYISALVGQWMKRKFGVRFLFDMRGLWADERVDGNLWNRANPLFNSIYKFFKKKEIQFLREADHTISLTHAAKDEICSWPAFNDGRAPKIQVIPCCVDLNLFNPAAVNPARRDALRAELGIRSGDFVLTYLGSLGTWYLLDEMLSFYKVLRVYIPSAQMLFVSHDEHEKIRAFAKEIGAEDAVHIRPAPRADVPALLSLSDYSIYFIKPAYSKKASSPTKQGEIMAMGIPAICNRGVGDLDFIAERYHIGLVVDETTENAYHPIARKIAEAYALGQQLFQPEVIINGAQQFYSLREGVARYKSTYQSILQAEVASIATA